MKSWNLSEEIVGTNAQYLTWIPECEKALFFPCQISCFIIVVTIVRIETVHFVMHVNVYIFKNPRILLLLSFFVKDM